MFRENKSHKDNFLFDFYSSILRDNQQKKLEEGWVKKFYDEIFSKIDESIFSNAYSEEYSRPNFPINILASLLILKMKFNYSDEELFEQYNYNIMFKYAFGLHDFAEYELVPRTYYNFKKRLVEYEESSKINLMELLCKNLNDSIKTKYNISTKEERMDSTLIWSNIKNMSRLELCLKTFKKFYSSIQDNEKDEKIEKYIESDSDNFCYKLKKEEVEKELEKIGYILYKYYQRYIENEKVQKTEEFKLIERLFYEQFEIENDQVKAKDIAKMRQLKL